MAIYLSAGDGVTADYLNLNDIAKHVVVEDGFSAPPPAEGERERVVSLALLVAGTSHDDLWANYRALETKLTQARKATGPYGHGSRVTLGIQFQTASNMVYFDVLDGALDVTELLFPQARLMTTMTLYCEPFARGAAQTLAANRLTFSDDLTNAIWILTPGGTGTTAVITAGQTDPNGGTTAFRLQADRGAGTTAADFSALVYNLTGLANPHDYATGVYLRSNTGASQAVMVREGSATALAASAVTVTTSWQQFSRTGSAHASTTGGIQIGTRGTSGSDQVLDILVWHPQWAQQATLPSYLPGTITGTSGFLIENIPGDVPALATLTLSDVSTGGAIVQRLRLGCRAMDSMTLLDFAPVVDATASSPGTSGAEAGTVGGTRSRITASSSWQTIARIDRGSGSYNNGLFRAFVRVRDSSGTPGTPTGLASAMAFAGSLPAGSYTVIVVSLDGSGNLSAASTPLATFTTTVVDQLNLTWTVSTAGATVTDHRVYFKRDSQAWKYQTTGSALGSYAFTSEAGATTADPPSEVSVGNSSIRVGVSLASGTTIHWGDPVAPVIRNSEWELLDMGLVALPPTPRATGSAPPAWRLYVQGRNLTATPTLDVDAVWLFPEDDPWLSSTMLEYVGLNLGTKRDWFLSTDTDMRVAAWLYQTGTTTDAGQVRVTNPFVIGPGDALVVVAAETADGVHDAANVALTPTISIVPRYRLVRGA